MDDKQADSGSDNTSQQKDSEDTLPAVQVENDGMADGQTVPTSRALVNTPEEASDSDLIEKEWVLKAKQIVEHTAEDPFAQQEELSKMKSDYLKKRYNKDIGTN